MCRRRDLNSHPLRDAILSRARIPIPPLRQSCYSSRNVNNCNFYGIISLMKIVINGIIINYNQIGTGDANILILHGWGCSYKEWLPVANFIKGYKITLIDLPGFGDSENPHKAFDIFEYSKFVSDFLKK